MTATALCSCIFAESIDLGNSGEYPGQEIVSFKDSPGDTELLAGFLQARMKRFHARRLSSRFSRIIQRRL
jgi:hypothetical protein